VSDTQLSVPETFAGRSLAVAALVDCNDALAGQSHDDDAAGVQSPYREALAGWADDWRERWGHRSNALEDAGLGWREAEIQAFVEVWNEQQVKPGRPGLAQWE
jgi:hypothetical protein